MIRKLFLITFLFFLISCEDEDNFSETVADFENISLAPESYINGSDGITDFASGNIVFPVEYDNENNEFYGFAVSNTKDLIKFGQDNLYTCVAGGGWDESDNYAVGHCVNSDTLRFVDYGGGYEVRGFFITNTYFTYASIKYGYGSHEKFGGVDGTDPDWYKITLRGIDKSNMIVDERDIYLADYRYDDDSKDFVLNHFVYIDLRSFGRLKELIITSSSSRSVNGERDIPQYFCLDDIRGRIY